jgi:hypothetical protein
LVKCLQEYFEEQQDSEVQQTIVLEVLGLNESQKVQATNAVKQAFPNSRAIRKGKERNITYGNLARKGVSVLPCSGSHASVVESSSITNLKQLIASVSSELDSVTKRIECHLPADEIKRDVIRFLLDKQRNLQFKVRDLSGDLESLYAKEVRRMDDDPSHNLCSNDRNKLNDELKTFISYIDIGLETDSLEEVNFVDKFISLPENVRENCPLLFDVLDTLFLHKEDGRPVSENRVKSAVPALSLLVSLKSQKIKNDFKIIFTCLCISFGAGMRFVTMLNKLGLTVSWDKAMAFLDFRKVKQQDEIKKLTPLEKPVILMFDNVNMYRGKHKHLRLFKSAGPVMWNFTVQAVLVPDITDLEEIFHDDSACLSPQKSILEMDPNEIFIEADQEKRELFQQVTDMFLLELLDTALNKIPESSRKLKNITVTGKCLSCQS